MKEMLKKYFDPNPLYLNRSNNIFALRFTSSILETKLPISIEIYCNSVENLHFDPNIVESVRSTNYVVSYRKLVCVPPRGPYFLVN